MYNRRIDQIQVKKETEAAKIYEIMTIFADSFHNEYIADDKNRKEYANKILKDGIFLTAYYHENPAGMACGYMNDMETKCAYVSFLGIEEEIGLLKGFVLAKLLAEGSKYGRERGMERIRLEVYKVNKHAYKLYRKLGFIDTGEASVDSVYMEMEFDRLDQCRELIDTQ